MIYVPLCIGLLQHHKLDEFMEHAGIENESEAVGSLCCMWVWALAQEIPQDGSLPSMGERSWARMLGVPPDRVQAVRNGMVAARFLDLEHNEYRIHNWDMYGGKVMADRQRKAEYARRKRSVPERNGTVPEHGSDVPATSPLKAEQSRAEQSTKKPRKRASQPTTWEVPPMLTGMKHYEASYDLCTRWSELLSEWQTAYPDIDIEAEIRKAHIWQVSNKPKTAKGQAAFISNWLSRSKPLQSSNRQYRRLPSSAPYTGPIPESRP